MSNISKQLEVLKSISDFDLESVEFPDEFDIAERKLSRLCVLCGGERHTSGEHYNHASGCLIRRSHTYGHPTVHGCKMYVPFEEWFIIASLIGKPVVLTRRDNDHKLEFCPKYMIENGKIKKEYI